MSLFNKSKKKLSDIDSNLKAKGYDIQQFNNSEKEAIYLALQSQPLTTSTDEVNKIQKYTDLINSLESGVTRADDNRDKVNRNKYLIAEKRLKLFKLETKHEIENLVKNLNAMDRGQNTEIKALCSSIIEKQIAYSEAKSKNMIWHKTEGEVKISSDTINEIKGKNQDIDKILQTTDEANISQDLWITESNFKNIEQLIASSDDFDNLDKPKYINALKISERKAGAIYARGSSSLSEFVKKAKEHHKERKSPLEIVVGYGKYKISNEARLDLKAIKEADNVRNDATNSKKVNFNLSNVGYTKIGENESFDMLYNRISLKRHSHKRDSFSKFKSIVQTIWGKNRAYTAELAVYNEVENLKYDLKQQKKGLLKDLIEGIEAELNREKKFDFDGESEAKQEQHLQKLINEQKQEQEQEKEQEQKQGQGQEQKQEQGQEQKSKTKLETFYKLEKLVNELDPSKTPSTANAKEINKQLKEINKSQEFSKKTLETYKKIKNNLDKIKPKKPKFSLLQRMCNRSTKRDRKKPSYSHRR